MAVDVCKLGKALQILKGPSEFHDLLGIIIRLSVMGKVSKKINGNLIYLLHDLQNICTVIHRLDWQKNLLDKGEIDSCLWMDYSRCDIELFYIELRSVFDYVAKIISEIYGGTPWSFEDLRKGISKNNYNHLQENVKRLIIDCNWFDQLRDIRDTNTHFGGQILPLNSPEGIIFQTYDSKGEAKCFTDEIMHTKNFVNFEHYSAMYFGYLIVFLDEFAVVISEELKIAKDEAKTTHGCYGLNTIEEWMKNLIEYGKKGDERILIG